MQNKRKATPVEALQEAIMVLTESMYEDTDIEPEEVQLAYKRFHNVLKYELSNLWEENHQLR